MKYVAIYRREDSGAPLTILKNARIRQIGTSEELGLGLGKMLFCPDRALEVENAKTKISSKNLG